MIRVEHLTKKFKDVTAVDDISFEIEEGEIYGLIGENGAGKTTTLRLLSTMLSLTSGEIYIDGLSVRDNPAKVREKIGILFGGETGLYDRLTARENIEYFGMLNGIARIDLDKRVNELAELFQMEEYIDRRTGKFSKGMKQKVALARSIVHDPEILFLDEPTSGLDIGVKKIVYDFIRGLTAHGKTVIFSSHNMDEVKKLCKNIIIINKGKLIYKGSIEAFEEQKGLPLEDAFMELISEEGDKNA